MSCLDCGEQFTVRTIQPHKSCISESAKYAARSNVNTQSFCSDCQLPLAGAVASVQHYESKKHKATLRRKKAAAKAIKGESFKPQPTSGDRNPGETMRIESAAKVSGKSSNVDDDKAEHPPLRAVPSITKKDAKRALRDAMSSVVKSSSSRKVKLARMVSKVRMKLGEQAPVDLESRIKFRSQRSPFMVSKKGSISLAS